MNPLIYRAVSVSVLTATAVWAARAHRAGELDYTARAFFASTAAYGLALAVRSRR